MVGVIQVLVPEVVQHWKDVLQCLVVEQALVEVQRGSDRLENRHHLPLCLRNDCSNHVQLEVVVVDYG